MTDEIHNYMGVGVVVTLLAAFLVTTSTSFAMTKPLLDNQVNKFSTAMSTYHYEDVYTNSAASLKSRYDGITREQCVKVITNNKEVIKSICILSFFVYTAGDKVTGVWNKPELPSDSWIKSFVSEKQNVTWLSMCMFSNGSPFMKFDNPPSYSKSVEDVINTWGSNDGGNARYNLEYLTDSMGGIHVLIRESFWPGGAQYSLDGGPRGPHTQNIVEYQIKTTMKIPNPFNSYSSTEEYMKQFGRPEILLCK